MPLNPQPLDTEVIELHRYYAKLKKNATYEKRVSWLGLGGDSEIAVVEYIVAYPGLGPHGNSVWANKTSDEKLRLFRHFRKHEVKKERLVKSTDGQSEVVAPRTKGQKIGQRKRPRTERTTTVPAKKEEKLN